MRAYRNAVMLISLGLAAPAAEAVAQAASPAPGDRVRVNVCDRGGGSSCWRIVGSFVSWTPDRIVLRDSLGVERGITAGPRSVLEVSRGKRSLLGRGLLFGFLGGAGLGAVATLGCRHEASDDIGLCYAWWPLLAGAGTVVGGLVGAMSTTERWISADQPQGLTVTGNRGGVRVGFTSTF